MEQTRANALTTEEQRSIAKELKNTLMPTEFGPLGKAWVVVLVMICAVGLFAYLRQLDDGLIVTGMRDFTSWGIYVSNFVFFVAISLVGSLISAILKLLKVSWAIPLTRISEIIAVSAIMFAALIIIVDMGRPERMLNLFAHGRLQSPIIWDVIVITTYLAISLLLLYLPLIPDLNIMKANQSRFRGWHQRIIRFFSIKWAAAPIGQYKILNSSIRTLSILIIPVALGIHTVTSWLFATTFRSGWDSTNFGPYFVSGAFMVGAAAVIAGMFVLRRQYNLKEFITDKHFDLMSKLLVLLSLIYLYFNINEYLVPAYKMKLAEAAHLDALFTGSYAPLFWSVQIFGMIVPIIVLFFKGGRRPWPVFIISLMVIVGAWFKRFLIVIPTLLHPFVPIQGFPEEWHHYMPTWEEWSITAGSLAGALLVVTLFIRILPIIPIWEIAEQKGVTHENLEYNENA
ncbi:MAG: polysulfide reductase NrfD [Flavobacteriales bacterium]|nr:polysulfide reductase NrfD [Flavobacteriales bacterium]